MLSTLFTVLCAKQLTTSNEDEFDLSATLWIRILALNNIREKPHLAFGEITISVRDVAMIVHTGTTVNSDTNQTLELGENRGFV